MYAEKSSLQRMVAAWFILVTKELTLNLVFGCYKLSLSCVSGTLTFDFHWHTVFERNACYNYRMNAVLKNQIKLDELMLFLNNFHAYF